MRMVGAAMLGLLSLLLLGCGTEQTTTEPQDPAESNEREVDGDDPPQAPPASADMADASAPAAASTEESADVPDPEPTDIPTPAVTTGDGLFPTVVGATASTSDGLSWSVAVTLSSEYDTRDRYADAWRVLDATDTELGIRVLGHDHANEQPFTRSTSVDIPVDIAIVYIEGRDQVNGWSGERFELALSR